MIFRHQDLLQTFTKLTGFILLFGVFYVVGVGSETEEINLSDFAIENNIFVINLYKALAKEKGNIFISPFSISTGMAMTYAGTNGNTASEFAEVMRFKTNLQTHNSYFRTLLSYLDNLAMETNIKFYLANCIWLQKGFPFKKDYISQVRNNYFSDVKNIDFRRQDRSRRAINGWVEEHTNNKILDLLKPGFINSDETKMVLTNAIYFKGKWEHKFNKSFTRDEPFYFSDTDSTLTPFMYRKAEYDLYIDDLCTVCEIPYESNNLAMVFIVPHKREGITQLEEKLSVELYLRWINEGYTQLAKVHIPKLTMASEFSLAKTLSDLGISNAFSGNADFSGITKKDGICLSEVAHKSVIQIDEEGSRIASATAIGTRKKLATPEDAKRFKADRPFLFLIRDTYSKLILFIGRVVKPKIYL